MLTLLAYHSHMDLSLKAKGDTGVDAHHTVEDVGICFRGWNQKSSWRGKGDT